MKSPVLAILATAFAIPFASAAPQPAKPAGAANSHRFAPSGMLAAVKYLVEELHADVNAADHEGNTALHHAAARGDNEMIKYFLSKGANRVPPRLHVMFPLNLASYNIHQRFGSAAIAQRPRDRVRLHERLHPHERLEQRHLV